MQSGGPVVAIRVDLLGSVGEKRTKLTSKKGSQLEVLIPPTSMAAVLKTRI
jgi:hypothetical protein